MISLGYETTNPLLNLGSLFILFALYLAGIVFTFVILWPLKKYGFAVKNTFNYLVNYFFFSKLFDVIFSTYFAFVLVSVLNLNSSPSDIHYHEKTIVFSSILLAFCVAIIPGLVLYVALQPKERFNEISFQKRYGTLY